MPDEIGRATFQASLEAGNLTGSRCRSCQALYLPPRPICPRCRNRDMEVISFTGKGKLTAYTVISVPPPLMAEAGFSRDNPYCSGVVELDEGVRVTARILGVDVKNPGRIKIGTPLRAEFIQETHQGKRKTILIFRALV
ncbi:MAG: Zn-ribbon domain-containing OB-fold protein [Chloroflexota bacterium]